MDRIESELRSMAPIRVPIVTHWNTKEKPVPEIPDPLTVLRDNHRTALDQQAQLSIEARRLAVQVERVTRDLALVRARVSAYGVLIAAINTALKPAKTETDG